MLTQVKKPLKVSKVSKDISTENADTLIREYKHKRWVQNSQTIGKPDSLSAWYSIVEMENFIALAKSNGGDGIKFYYGAFPEDYTERPEYAGRQTLVSIATKSKLTGNGSIANKDIYIEKNGRIKILSGIVPSLCPPICPFANDGGMGDLGITIVDKGRNGMEMI
jgi:hypothetical protein